MRRTEAARGSGPVFCLTPNLVFAPALACTLLLPSCHNVFFFFCTGRHKAKNHQSYQATAWRECSSTFIVHMFLVALVAKQNCWVTLLFSILHPIIQRQAEFRKTTQTAKNHTKEEPRSRRGRRTQGHRDSIQHPAAFTFHPSASYSTSYNFHFKKSLSLGFYS